MAEPKLIKVCLTNKGEDTETPWAHDLGPAHGAPPGSRKVKLVNVPFMHAKPTWGDTIVVTPVADSFPTWDRDGLPWKQIGTRIVEDGGRWAMIVDYIPTPDVTDAEAFEALGKACNPEFVCEGAWGPREGEAGRVYLAVPKQLTPEQVMDKLVASALPMRLIQVHPEPRRRTRSGTETGITPVQPRRPAPVEVSVGSSEMTAKKSQQSAPEMPAPMMVTPESSGPISVKPSKAAKPAPVKSVDEAWSKSDIAIPAASPIEAAVAKSAPSKGAPPKSAPSPAPAKPSTPANAETKSAAAKPTAPPVPVKASAKPAVKSAAKPATATAKPAVKSAAKHATATAKPAARPAAKPATATAKPTARPAAKKPANAAAKKPTAAKPAAKKPAAKKPAAKKPAAKAAGKKPATKAAAKKPAAKAAAKKSAAKKR